MQTSGELVIPGTLTHGMSTIGTDLRSPMLSS